MGTRLDARFLRARAPIAAIVAGTVALVGVAVSGAAKPLPGLDMIQTGHWIYNSALASAFHIDGSGKQADAQVPLPDADPGSRVAQGPTQGYAVSPSRIIQFGKSTLSVENSTQSPANEWPVTIETKGGPYAVYRDAGVVIRLGEGMAKIPVGGRLGDPVATADGRLWLHQVDNGLLCELAPDADRVSCPIGISGRHKGSLVVTADGPVFVDNDEDTVRPVASTGFGDPVRLGVDVPETAVAASSDVDGKLAILDRAAAKLHLIGGGRPVTVPLPPGDYVGLASSGSVVALVDKGNRTLHTFDSEGRVKDSRPIPGGAEHPPVRGQDSRVYVDGADGAHVLVVDQDGAVNEVPVTGGPNPADKPNPVIPPTPGRPADRPQAPLPPQGRPDDKPVAPVQPKPPPKTQPPVPASPPGAPRSVTATPGDGSATVKWNAAATNGATLTGYRITWAGGEKTVTGGTRTTSITGLANGTAYTFTVAASNRAGTGPGATSAPVTPVKPQPSVKVPGAPAGLDVRIKTGDTDANVTWKAAAANGAPVTAYHVSWRRADGSGAGSAKVAGTGRAHLIADIGIEQPITVTVTAENSAGRGAAAQVTKARGDEPADRGIVISRGADTTADQCEPPVCGLIRIVMTGFTPGKTVSVTCTTDDGVHGSKSAKIGQDGKLTFEAFPQGSPGRRVWISAEGVESNKLVWK
ncbi:fibronectin type III domain-containing protein [Amycolatopsis sp. lyj-112]|uniref:fibronectin type III domain-containing protein n=1 Tax=Amycolatopsis sp. lyj-112 TaxID=2789288 RepID=UPI00397A49BC